MKIAKVEGSAFVGISGYDYKPWRGRFYPEGLPARRWLAAAVRQALSRQPGTPYWAVPTLHGKKAAIGIYIRSSDGKSHHIYVPVK